MKTLQKKTGDNFGQRQRENCKRFTTGYKKYLKEEEFQRIQEWINTRLKSPSSRMLLRFLMFTACPPIDAVNLRLDNFSKDFQEAYVVRRKTGRFYTVVIPDFLAEELRFFVRDFRWCMLDGFVFFASFRNQSRNLHLQTSTVRLIFSRLRRELGLDDVYYTTRNRVALHRVTVYTLRHYCAERVYRCSGNDIVAVKEYLNHRKLETTEKYLRGFGGSDRRRCVINEAFVPLLFGT